ncbi:hypothetical protein [Sphingomonas sp. R86520]
MTAARIAREAVQEAVKAEPLRVRILAYQFRSAISDQAAARLRNLLK